MSDPEIQKLHKVLFSPTTLKLGEIQWYLVKADTELSSATLERTPKPGGGPVRFRITTFGKEVGQDFIHWWVFRRETKIEELLTRTQQLLLAAQRLKEESAKLKHTLPKTYDALILALKEFADQHASDIDILHSYVLWLAQKHMFAPVILFSYRVWGTTRTADHSINLTADTLETENSHIIKKLTEIVFGLLERESTYIFRLIQGIYFCDIYESKVPEEWDEDEEIVLPMDEVYIDTSFRVLNEFAIYFEKIRDSLRNIIIEIEKYHISHPIEKFILNQPVLIEETRHHEFKDISQSKRPDDSIKNTADEYVVAFLNSEGGTIYWGIRDTDRVVVGVNLDYRQRDNIRRIVSQKLTEIRPSLDPTGYRIEFYPIYDATDDIIADLYVVEISVNAIRLNEPYFTGSNEAFVRIDGAKKKLMGPELTEWIRNRLSMDK